MQDDRQNWRDTEWVGLDDTVRALLARFQRPLPRAIVAYAAHHDVPEDVAEAQLRDLVERLPTNGRGQWRRSENGQVTRLVVQRWGRKFTFSRDGEVLFEYFPAPDAPPFEFVMGTAAVRRSRRQAQALSAATLRARLCAGDPVEVSKAVQQRYRTYVLGNNTPKEAVRAAIAAELAALASSEIDLAEVVEHGRITYRLAGPDRVWFLNGNDGHVQWYQTREHFDRSAPHPSDRV